ncbi:MAG: hypothetical protein JXR36_00965 [Bacteroidales bacterium]|nr:hypothetical protein [Bacteroidales bacterium]
MKIKRIILLNFLGILISLNINAQHLFEYSLVKQSNHESLIADSILFSEAQFYLYRGMSNIAIPKLLELLEQTQVNSKLFFKTQIALSEAYRQRREYEKGFDMLYDAVKSPYIEDEEKASAYTRIAALFNESRKTEYYADSAYKYSEMALYISEKNSFDFVTATAKNEIGWILKQRGEQDQALLLLNESMYLFKELKMYLHMSNVAINISSVYMTLNRFEEANRIIDSTMNYCDKTNDQYMLMRLYLHKSKLYKLVENYESAFYYQEEARRLQLVFLNNLLDKQIMEMAAKYDLELKEAKILEGQKESELRRQDNVMLIIIIIILIISLLAAISIYRLNRKNLLQEKNIAKMKAKILEIDYAKKNQELSGAIANVVSYNKVLESVKTAISQKNQQEAISILNANINTEQNWHSFLLSFNQSFPDFFSQLKIKHPNLSENEIKLCALLKAGFKSKDIAGILSIAQTSVDKGRQRLRKKINVDADIDLIEYFKNL